MRDEGYRFDTTAFRRSPTGMTDRRGRQDLKLDWLTTSLRHGARRISEDK
jgi:hypothetical protein